MKHPNRLPVIVADLGLVAFLLRLSLYHFGTDEKGLLVTGHPLETALWLLAAATAIFVVAVLRKETGSRPYKENFPGNTSAAFGCILFAAALAFTAVKGLYGFTLLERLRSITGILAAVALIAVAVFRIQGRRPVFLLHLLVCIALTLHTVNHYRSWSSCPQLQDAFFPMMGCIGLMLFSYYQTAFDVDSGSRRMQLGTGLLAAFCCFAALPGSDTPALYLAGNIWTLTNLCSLTPTVEKKEETQ